MSRGMKRLDKIDELLAIDLGSKSKKGNRSLKGDDFHVYYIKQAYVKSPPPNFTKRHVFYPTEVPRVGPNEMVVLHRHPMYEPCRSKYGCHEVGFDMRLYPELKKIWEDLT